MMFIRFRIWLLCLGYWKHMFVSLRESKGVRNIHLYSICDIKIHKLYNKLQIDYEIWWKHAKFSFWNIFYYIKSNMTWSFIYTRIYMVFGMNFLRWIFTNIKATTFMYVCIYPQANLLFINHFKINFIHLIIIYLIIIYWIE